MNMKSILALAAVAVATVAGASTNYVEIAATRGLPLSVVRRMSQDSALADPAAFRATLEAVDAAMATGAVKVALAGVSRCCPLTARAVLGRCDRLGERARADLLAVCGYGAENCPLALRPGEEGYVNFLLQAADAGLVNANCVRWGVLNAAIVPARRTVRAKGGSFVGRAGGAKVKAILDALAAELNAPRFGRAGEILAEIGIETEWKFAQSRMLTDEEVAEIRAKLLGGEIPFSGLLQGRLCVVLGVEGYNAFVREYNGK